MTGGDLGLYLHRGEMGSRGDAERCFRDLLGESGVAGAQNAKWAAKAADIYDRQRDGAPKPAATSGASTGGRSRFRVPFDWEVGQESAG